MVNNYIIYFKSIHFILKKFTSLYCNRASYQLLLFRESILLLQATKTPTLHLVWLVKESMSAHLEKPVNNEALRPVQKLMQNKLQSKFQIPMQAKIATVLHPSFKDLKLPSLNLFEKQKIYDDIRQFVKPSVENFASSLTSRGKRSDDNQTSSKKLCIRLFDTFGANISNENSGDTYDELNRYLLCEPVRNVENALEWWNANREKYPSLSNLARKIFAIPASSAASECVFSTAGRSVTNLRSSLNPSTLSDLLFLHYN